MKYLTISLILIFTGLFLFGCKEKSTGIEIVPNLESIYTPISQVDTPPKASKGFLKTGTQDILDAVKPLIVNKTDSTFYYQIKVRLYLNENGTIDKLKDTGSETNVVDSLGTMHQSVPVDELDKAIALKINDWKFAPAIKNGKLVKCRLDLIANVSIFPNGVYSVSLNDFLSNLPGINEFVKVDKMPEVLKNAVPIYPELAKRAGIEGTVYVKLLISENGMPLKAVVMKSDNKIFDQTATDAAMKMKFTPAIKDGHPVPLWVVVPFRFKLK